MFNHSTVASLLKGSIIASVTVGVALLAVTAFKQLMPDAFEKAASEHTGIVRVDNTGVGSNRGQLPRNVVYDKNGNLQSETPPAKPEKKNTSVADALIRACKR